MKYRDTFTTPFEQYTDREGQPFTVLTIIDRASDTIDGEVTPMFRIKFADDFITDAWPEEVLPSRSDYTLAEVCEHGYDSHIAASIFDKVADAWEWLYEYRRAQLDAANVVGDPEDPYDGDECLRDLNAKVTVAVNRPEHDFGDDSIEGVPVNGESFDYKIAGEYQP